MQTDCCQQAVECFVTDQACNLLNTCLSKCPRLPEPIIIGMSDGGGTGGGTGGGDGGGSGGGSGGGTGGGTGGGSGNGTGGGSGPGTGGGSGSQDPCRADCTARAAAETVTRQHAYDQCLRATCAEQNTTSPPTTTKFP
jgi:hypothetical protein